MTVCHPDNAIWPDPSVLPGEEPDTGDEEAHAAWELLTQQVEIALARAWTTLQVLTAGALAICPIVVRPCREDCAVPSAAYWRAPVTGYAPGMAPFWPAVSDGVWSNIWCGHRGDCGCSAVRQIKLPGPVGRVVEVRIDGAVVDPEAYRVDDNAYLVRHDGEGWPTCQDFNLPAGEENTWSVTYYRGSVGDIDVRAAAGLLAAEWLLAMTDPDNCRLPSGTVAVVRQAIQIEIEKDMFEGGLTGIPEVDQTTARFNPYRRKSPAVFFNPDSKVARQTTFGG
jgi:hypothetical protein